MIGGKRIVAIIPARGGSKGVPRKNVRLLGGKPLIEWTIQAAQKSRYLDRIVLSSDDEEAIAIAHALGCDVPFVRPKELASDTASSIDVVRHAIGMIPNFDVVVLLQPTSPFRNSKDIDTALEQMMAAGAQSCISVCTVENSPYWMYTMTTDRRLARLLKDAPEAMATRRQDLPPLYMPNGAIYIIAVEELMHKLSFVTEDTVAYAMSERSSLDIDTELDLRLAEILIGEQQVSI